MFHLKTKTEKLLFNIRNYLDRLSEEVNDKLQESGQVTVSELCKAYDLPGDFLTQVLFFLNNGKNFKESE